MVDKFFETNINNNAKISGSILLPCSGFDSVPADLGSFIIYKLFKNKYNTLPDVITSYYKIKGGWSGGTILTGILNDKSGNNIYKNNYLNKIKPFQHFIFGPCTSFEMGPINIPNVLRSFHLNNINFKNYNE